MKICLEIRRQMMKYCNLSYKGNQPANKYVIVLILNYLIVSFTNSVSLKTKNKISTQYLVRFY
jgi:hypothetical protein